MREVFSSFNEVDFTFKGAFENPVRGKVDAASGRLKGNVGGKDWLGRWTKSQSK